ncbi:MAG: ComF family protein [Coxiellaceae bacterium]|nr:ComF family protein [Coxiellaceae bacterium]
MLLSCRHHCMLCLSSHRSPDVICEPCLHALPWMGHHCFTCAQPLPVQQQYCGRCITLSAPYHTILAPFYYQQPLSMLVSALKFSNHLGMAYTFARLMMPILLRHYQDYPWPQCIIPVPLHRSRLVQRGYNQALEISNYLARAFSIPIKRFDCQRNRATESQRELKRERRWQNLAGAFSTTNELPYQHVAIVDDVVTTESTIRAVCDSLQSAGVRNIDVWCIARTPQQNPPSRKKL